MVDYRTNAQLLWAKWGYGNYSDVPTLNDMDFVRKVCVKEIALSVAQRDYLKGLFEQYIGSWPEVPSVRKGMKLKVIDVGTFSGKKELRVQVVED